MNEEERKKQEQEAQQNWTKHVSEEDQKITTTHSKKEYTFTKDEARQVLKVVGMNALAAQIQQLAQGLANDMINNNVLKRLGIIPNNEVKVLYDATIGKFAVWMPRKGDNTPKKP